MILISYIGHIPDDVVYYVQTHEPEIMKEAVVMGFTKTFPVAVGEVEDRTNPLIMIYYTEKINADKIRETIQDNFAVDVALIPMEYYKTPRNANGIRCEKP